MIITNFPINVSFVSTPRFAKYELGKKIPIEDGYSDFNLATHVGDDPKRVEQNRQFLIEEYHLPSAPKYLEQVHSDTCLQYEDEKSVGDALISHKPNQVCAVLTADCLPIFITDSAGTQVGVAHAGWKGLLAGVIESLAKGFSDFDPNDLIVHFGPAISQENFEVGEEVRDQFMQKNPALKQAFKENGDKYLLDLYLSARIILNALGIRRITGGAECTFKQANKYFSYRRDGDQSGRMAHLIWINH